MLIPQRYDFSSKSQLVLLLKLFSLVVVNTTKVRFFKQITTSQIKAHFGFKLLLIPQRYDFSSKSQPIRNHVVSHIVVVNTTKVRFFKQITTSNELSYCYYTLLLIPQRYDFSSKSQPVTSNVATFVVVVNTTKVRFFKQITTYNSLYRDA